SSQGGGGAFGWWRRCRECGELLCRKFRPCHAARARIPGCDARRSRPARANRHGGSACDCFVAGLARQRAFLRITSAGVRVWPAHLGSEDRKSTRLNSSHVKSSYAVFCLKKETV